MVEEISSHDIVVVGHGVSGLSAGLSAEEHGADPVILEKSPKSDRGGHTQYAGGAFRLPIENPDIVEAELDVSGSLDRYTEQDFYDDLMQVSNGRADPELCEILVENAYDAVKWLNEFGLEWRETFSDETGYGTVEGTVQAQWESFARGKAVVEVLAEEAVSRGIDIHYDTEMREVLTDDENRVIGVEAHTPDGKVRYKAPAVIICAGAYVSNAEKRTRYFGRHGDAYTVRGSRYNTGEALEAAMDAGALPGGEWGGAHQVLLDEQAPKVEGGRTRINGYQYSVILNKHGDRYVDEGEDWLLKTYAKMGKRVYDQPDQTGYIIFDSKVEDLVMSQIDTAPISAPDLSTLLDNNRIDIDKHRALETIDQYNAACDPDDFKPDELDGNSTTGLDVEKTNWAMPIDEAPYYCFPAKAGITFAFGGLRTNTDAEVLNTQNQPMSGLWAVGNSTSEFFYGNYPGGSALTRGAVFGRRAGRLAADEVIKLRT